MPVSQHLPVVDSHLHLWDPARLRYPWLAEVPSLNRSFGMTDLGEHLGEVPLGRAVFVQCDCLPEDAGLEVKLARGAAQRDARLGGAVAFAPLERGGAVAPWLEELAGEPFVRGVRRLLQTEPDPGFCLTGDFVDGVRLLARHAFTFDLCILHPQLEAATELVRRVPEVTFVLDHLGKPGIRDGLMEPWATQLRELAALPNVVAKLSGLSTEADPENWKSEDLQPYLAHALDCFGPGRLLFGGDWPVMTLATTYERWFEEVRTACAGLSGRERQGIFADNARRVYRLA